MPIKKSTIKSYCKYCGAEIKRDARFCKKCGKDLSRENDLIKRINTKINLLSVLIGLVVTVIIFSVGASYLGVIIIDKVMDVSLYLFLVLFSMLFLGGLTAGITGSQNIDEGLINGGVLSLLFFIIVGIIFGLYLFIIVGIASLFVSAFSSLGTSTASNVTSTPVSQGDIMAMVKGILIIITCFFAGPAGGALGGWIRRVIR